MQVKLRGSLGVDEGLVDRVRIEHAAGDDLRSLNAKTEMLIKRGVRDRSYRGIGLAGLVVNGERDARENPG